VSLADRVEVEDVSLPIGGSTRAMVRIFRSEDAPQPSPVVLFLCDQGPGSSTEEPYHYPRDIAADIPAAVVVPRAELDLRGSELEPLYKVLYWIAEQGQRRGLDGSRMALAGQGSGADLCSRLALLARERGTPGLRAGSLLWVPDRDPAAWRDIARFLGAALRDEEPEHKANDLYRGTEVTTEPEEEM
jgi:acetyl esterase